MRSCRSCNNCGSPIRRGNITGCCQKHAHMKGYCECERCAPMLHRQPEPKVLHPDRVSKIVRVVTATSSEMRAVVVTLPRAPWEMRDDRHLS